MTFIRMYSTHGWNSKIPTPSIPSPSATYRMTDWTTRSAAAWCLNRLAKSFYRRVDMAYFTSDKSTLLRRTACQKRAYGYFNFEWQGNDALLFGPDKGTILLSGKAARDFETELERIEEEIPHDQGLE